MNQLSPGHHSARMWHTDIMFYRGNWYFACLLRNSKGPLYPFHFLRLHGAWLDGWIRIQGNQKPSRAVTFLLALLLCFQNWPGGQKFGTKALCSIEVQLLIFFKAALVHVSYLEQHLALQMLEGYDASVLQIMLFLRASKQTRINFFAA